MVRLLSYVVKQMTELTEFAIYIKNTPSLVSYFLDRGLGKCTHEGNTSV